MPRSSYNCLSHHTYFVPLQPQFRSTCVDRKSRPSDLLYSHIHCCNIDLRTLCQIPARTHDSQFFNMCDYTQVDFACSHKRYTVRSWCIKYQETHKRCIPNIVAMYVLSCVHLWSMIVISAACSAGFFPQTPHYPALPPCTTALPCTKHNAHHFSRPVSDFPS